MGQEHLENLALLSIKNEEFGDINVDGVIDKFLTTKPGCMLQLYEFK